MPRRDHQFAIVIEPKPMLADMVADALRRRGYEVVTAATHVGGAQMALDHGRVDLAVAAVPAPGEDRTGAYLLEARKVNPRMRMVVMLSDPSESTVAAPADSVKLVKPFTIAEFNSAVDQAITVSAT